jgi:hypothetical protein
MPTRRKAPSARDVGLVIAVLDRISKDEQAVTEWRTSFQGNINFRYSAVTNSMPWTVDIYGSDYFRVQVGTSLGAIVRSTYALHLYLLTRIGS